MAGLGFRVSGFQGLGLQGWIGGFVDRGFSFIGLGAGFPVHGHL